MKYQKLYFFSLTVAATEAFAPTSSSSFGLRTNKHNQHRQPEDVRAGTKNTQLHLVDPNAFVQFSVLFGAGATVYFMGDTSSTATKDGEGSSTVLDLGFLKVKDEKEDVDVTPVLEEEVEVEEEEEAEEVVAAAVEVEETKEVEEKEIVDDSAKKEAERAAAVEAQRKADMEVVRKKAAKQKAEAERAAAIEAERKADMDAARKLAAEKAKAEAEAAQPEETAVEEVSEEKVAIFGKIRGKVKPVLIASVVASAAFKVIKMYVGRGLL